MSRREKNRYVLGLMIRNGRRHQKATCSVCDREYFQAMSSVQAPRCAAVVIRRRIDGQEGILGCYGSRFDLQFFPFKRHGLPVGTDPVCDRCITVMIKSGRVGRGQDWHDPFILR